MPDSPQERVALIRHALPFGVQPEAMDDILWLLTIAEKAVALRVADVDGATLETQEEELAATARIIQRRYELYKAIGPTEKMTRAGSTHGKSRP